MTSLQERLRRLKGGQPISAQPESPAVERGSAPGATATSDSPAGHGGPAVDPRTAASGGLAERLRRLSSARASGGPRRALSDAELAERLGAEVVSDGVLRLERRWPLQRRHGRVHIGDCILALPELHASAPADPAGWVLLDTETSGLAGGTGTWVFVFGAARFDGGRLLLRQHLLTRLDAEPTFLESVAADLRDATLLISYNGKSFDVPLLSTRFRLAGARSPVDGVPHLDLLYHVRRAFSACWPDCRLATAERRLLDVRRGDDLPGAEAPAAWLDWLRRGDPQRLGPVLRHNRTDLLSLAALVPELASAYDDPADLGADAAAVARHWLRLGEADRARRILAGQRRGTSPDAELLLAALYRRRGDWASAALIWERLAASGDQRGMTALAIYHEHRTGNLQSALALAQNLTESPSRERRCRRLEHKIARIFDNLI